jgi:hypothetical protein
MMKFIRHILAGIALVSLATNGAAVESSSPAQLLSTLPECAVSPSSSRLTITSFSCSDFVYLDNLLIHSHSSLDLLSKQHNLRLHKRKASA